MVPRVDSTKIGRFALFQLNPATMLASTNRRLHVNNEQITDIRDKFWNNE
jgi:hypothetical protein